MVQIVVSLLVVIASLAGFSGTLYAAQDDLPGQALYPLKTWSEDALISLTADPSLRTERLLNLAQRRVEEAVALMQEGQEPPDIVFQRMERHLAQAMEQIALQENGKMARNLAQVENRLRAMQQMLATTPATPIQERWMQCLEAWRRIVQTGETDPAEFRLRVRQRVGMPSPYPTGVPGPMETPPGPRWTPAGPMETPPGPRWTPAGPVKTPPGPRWTPAGPMETPPGPRETPPGPRWTPAGPMETPSGPRATSTPAPTEPPGMMTPGPHPSGTPRPGGGHGGG